MWLIGKGQGSERLKHDRINIKLVYFMHGTPAHSNHSSPCTLSKAKRSTSSQTYTCTETIKYTDKTLPIQAVCALVPIQSIA